MMRDFGRTAGELEQSYLGGRWELSMLRREGMLWREARPGGIGVGVVGIMVTEDERVLSGWGLLVAREP